MLGQVDCIKACHVWEWKKMSLREHLPAPRLRNKPSLLACAGCGAARGVSMAPCAEGLQGVFPWHHAHRGSKGCFHGTMRWLWGCKGCFHGTMRCEVPRGVSMAPCAEGLQGVFPWHHALRGSKGCFHGTMRIGALRGVSMAPCAGCGAARGVSMTPCAVRFQGVFLWHHVRWGSKGCFHGTICCEAPRGVSMAPCA